MQSKTCKYAKGLEIHFTGLRQCILSDRNPLYTTKYNNKSFIKDFLEVKEKMLSKMQKGIIPRVCQNCFYLYDKDDNEKESPLKINYIDLFHWTQCNSACFYCSNRNLTKLKITKWKNQKGVVNALKILENLKQLDLLDKDLIISQVGGEPTLLKEFVDILKFVIKNNYSIYILSNGILYEKYIVKALEKTPSSSLTVSLDCGTRETYKKIKGVDEFNNVIKNLREYVIQTKDFSDKIHCKYIILEGVNDNKEEIDRWIDICEAIGIKSFFPSIEFCHSMEQKTAIPEHICELYEYIKEKVSCLNPFYKICTYDFVEDYIKRRSY